MLPKHFLIQFDERIPKMPKKVILDDVLGSQIAVKVSVLYAYSNHAPNFFEANSTHLKEHVMTSGHHKTTLDIWIDHYGQKNYQDCLILMEIMAILQIEEYWNILA